MGSMNFRERLQKKPSSAVRSDKSSLFSSFSIEFPYLIRCFYLKKGQRQLQPNHKTILAQGGPAFLFFMTHFRNIHSASVGK